MPGVVGVLLGGLGETPRSAAVVEGMRELGTETQAALDRSAA